MAGEKQRVIDEVKAKVEDYENNMSSFLAKFNDYAQRGRPCLLADIEKCSAPCVGGVEPAIYQEYTDGLAARPDPARVGGQTGTQDFHLSRVVPSVCITLQLMEHVFL